MRFCEGWGPSWRCWPLVVRANPPLRTRRRQHTSSLAKGSGATTVKLSPDAVKRLGIETVAVKTDSAAATRSLGGEVVVPEGRMVSHRAGCGHAHWRPGPARHTRGARRPPDDARAARVGRARPAHRGAAGGRRGAGGGGHGAPAAPAARAAAEGWRRQRAQRRRGARAAAGRRRRAERRARAARRRMRRDRSGRRARSSITAPFDGVVQAFGGAGTDGRGLGAARCRSRRSTRCGCACRSLPATSSEIDDAQPASVTRLGGADAPRAGDARHRAAQGDPTAASVDLFYELSGAGAGASAGRAGDGGASARGDGAGPRRPGGGGALRHPRRHLGLRGSRRQRLRPPARRGRAPRRRPRGRRARPRPKARRSSPPAPRSCSAPSSGPGTRRCAGWSRSRCATASSSSRWRCCCVVGAARTLRTTPLDVFPEFAPPLVEIQTEAPGLSTDEVEALVTRAARERAQRHARARRRSARSRCSACRRSC